MNRARNENNISIKLACVVLLVCFCTTSGAGEKRNPKKQMLYKYPKYRVAKSIDVDERSCAGYKNLGTEVRLDLNGDGEKDYVGVLVKKTKGEKIEWNGKKFTKKPIIIAVSITGFGKGGKIITIDRGPAIFPLGKGVRKVSIENGKIGNIRKLGEQRGAFSLVACESGETAFYWDSGELVSVVLSE